MSLTVEQFLESRKRPTLPSLATSTVTDPRVTSFLKSQSTPRTNYVLRPQLDEDDEDEDSFIEKMLKSVFKAPLELGKDIASFTPDVKAARESERKLLNLAERVKARGLDRRQQQIVGKILDNNSSMDNIIEPKSKTQMFGDLLGTALFVAPVGTLFKGLRGAKLGVTALRGSLEGASFGFADSIAEGDDT